jgi:peroxidase
VAVGNPDLLETVRLGPVLEGLGGEREYRNDEQIDDALRTILFLVPVPGVPVPSGCTGQQIKPICFNRIDDLGAIDIARERDHGVPPYNELRRAYGLPPKASFEAVTGEPATAALSPNDTGMLDFVSLLDAHGNPVPLGDEVDAVTGVRRTTLAARLRAVYGDMGRLDAIVGMLAEPHVAGSEFGELQLAMWKRQFQRLRDGDRFFYENDPALPEIQQRYGITYRHTLADLIRLDGGGRARRDVFRLPR